MEQQHSQGNKNQRSGGAVLDTPVISYSQDFRLTQSQELMDTAKLAEMLTTFPTLSQGERLPSERFPSVLLNRHDSLQFHSQEFSSSQTPYCYNIGVMCRERPRENSTAPMERSDSLANGLLQPLRMPSSQPQDPAEPTEEVVYLC